MCAGTGDWANLGPSLATEKKESVFNWQGFVVLVS